VKLIYTTTFTEGPWISKTRKR